MHDDNRITYIAETDARNKRVAFGIKAKDRVKHVYVIGKTGMGKSTLLENMAVQDIQNGEGMAFMDPHGKSADLLLEYVPKDRVKDVVYFAPFDSEYPISFNVMEDVGPEKRHLVVSGLISAFKKIWVDAWSARMEYILTNTILALLEYPESTLMGVNKMLSDKEYRKKIVDNVQDPTVKSFWVDEFAKYGQNYMQEAGAAIQNKIGQFLANPMIRNVIGQPRSSFDIRKLMDERKIVIINLSKGRVGEVNANLLGSMLITKIYLGAMSRADIPESVLHKLPNFYFYVDEFQSFANESFQDILSEARKYKLNLTIAHQYIEQMTEEVRAAVFGNVGTMITFRVGALDAAILEKEFGPTFMIQDLVNLGFAQIYLKLMINGVTSQPFSAVTLPPIKKPETSLMQEIIEYSRLTYSQPRAIVEEQIRALHTSTQKEIAAPSERGERSEGGEWRDRRREGAPKDPDRPPREDRPKREERRDDREEKKKPFQGIRIEMEPDGKPKLVQEDGSVVQPVPVKEAGPAGAPERDTLPLSNLKNPPKKFNNGKEATPKNIQSLRDVLSSVLVKKPEPAAAAAPAEKESAKEAAPKEAAAKREPAEREPRRSASTVSEAASAPEVPEKVLKEVLSMDER